MDTFADITGDGRADIVAFGQTEAESHSAVSIGGGNFRDFAVASDGFGAGSGWNRQHPRQVIDLNADGRADIVGFGIQACGSRCPTATARSPPASCWSVTSAPTRAGTWTSTCASQRHHR